MARSRFPLRVRIVLGALMVALPAVASAPSDQYARFDRDATEIDDLQTGLDWDRKQVQKFTAAGAPVYCDSTIFPGVGRVPTVKELLTLVDEDRHSAYENGVIVLKAIDQDAFPDTNTPTDAPYWTSTVDTASGQYWTVDFATGITALASGSLMMNVRCVK